MSHEGIESFLYAERLRNRPHSAEDRQNVIPELKPHLEDLLEQLRPNIDSGEYDAIIQEGSSATLPAYILGRAIGDIYKIKGFQYPAFITLNGKKEVCESGEYEEMNSKASKKISQANPSTSLVITDSVVTGGSLKNALRFLTSHGIRADVATILLRPSLSQKLSSDIQIFSSDEWLGYSSNLIVYASPTYTGRGRGPQQGSIVSDPTTKANMAHVWPQAQELRRDLVAGYLERESLA